MKNKKTNTKTGGNGMTDNERALKSILENSEEDNHITRTIGCIESIKESDLFSEDEGLVIEMQSERNHLTGIRLILTIQESK